MDKFVIFGWSGELQQHDVIQGNTCGILVLAIVSVGFSLGYWNILGMVKMILCSVLDMPILPGGAQSTSLYQFFYLHHNQINQPSLIGFMEYFNEAGKYFRFFIENLSQPDTE